MPDAVSRFSDTGFLGSIRRVAHLPAGHGRTWTSSAGEEEMFRRTAASAELLGHFEAAGQEGGDLPEKAGLFYRVHLRDQPLDEAHARSRPLRNVWKPGSGLIPTYGDDQYRSDRVNAEVGQRGYSSVRSPFHLATYMHHFGWPRQPEQSQFDRRDVIAFHGRQVGTGMDREPLVVPAPDHSCCGRVVHSRMSWDHFSAAVQERSGLPDLEYDSMLTNDKTPAGKSPWSAWKDSPAKKSIRRNREKEDQRRQAQAELLGHFEAASRPGRGEQSCGCCDGGTHSDGTSCARCDGTGMMARGDASPHCEGQPQARRRHWRGKEAAVEDYRMQHQGPDADDGEAMHELGTKGAFPPDVYDRPDLYDGDASSVAQVRRARGNPEQRVTMYRAMPSPYHKINTGDWVTPSKEYALSHAAESNPDNDYAVLRSSTKAKYLRNEGNSLNEWSYHGPTVHFPSLTHKGGKNGGWKNSDELTRAQWADVPSSEEIAAERQRHEGSVAEVVTHFEDPAQVTVEHQQRPSGGSQYPHMHVLTATHPDGMTAELRYMMSKRNGNGVVDHSFLPGGYAESLGKPLVRKARQIHPGALIKGLPGIDEDWGQHLLSVTSVHRNLTMRLSPEDHAIVHDESVPKAQRARHLMGLMERGGASMHWASQRGRAAAGKFGDHEFRAPGDTQVSVSAAPPAPEHVETDPERISRNGGYAYQAPDWEVPLKEGGRVSVSSVRWRAGNGGWTHHQFRGGHQFTAGTAREVTAVRQREGTGTGDALEAHRAERLEGGHLKEAAVSLAARYEPGMANPHTGGSDWFHGTQAHPDHFVSGFSHSEHHDNEDEEVREHLSHWNTLLGSHFAADHGVAAHFAEHGASVSDPDEEDWGDEPASRYQQGDPQSVVHARLHLRNPKRYRSEYDMDHEAYEGEYGERKNYIANHFRDGYEDEDHHSEHYDPESAADGEEWPLAARYRHDDEHPIDAGQVFRPGLFEAGHPGMPERTRWLNSHPDKGGIARRFRERLESQGHDGILYGNEFEGTHATGPGKHSNLSAVIFRPEQAEITQHHPAARPCLGRDEAEMQRRLMPQPGQDELPGFEEHADRFPNGFRHGSALIAHFGEPRTAAGPWMQQKLFHVKPDPTLNVPESGRHNPDDPHAHVRWRQEHEEGYQPPAESLDDPERGNYDEDRGLYHHPEHGWHCRACGDFHYSPDEAEEHDTAHTDWDEVYPYLPEQMHRGLRLDDDGTSGRVLHPYRGDEHGSESTARGILHHLGDFGSHWTPSESQARHYAGIGGYGRPEGHTMHVVVHARKPEREDIETDPEELAAQRVIGFDKHDDAEIPLRAGAPVHVTGVSWKFHDEPDSAWRRHDFDTRAQHQAAALAPGAGASPVDDAMKTISEMAAAKGHRPVWTPQARHPRSVISPIIRFSCQDCDPPVYASPKHLALPQDPAEYRHEMIDDGNIPAWVLRKCRKTKKAALVAHFDEPAQVIYANLADEVPALPAGTSGPLAALAEAVGRPAAAADVAEAAAEVPALLAAFREGLLILADRMDDMPFDVRVRDGVRDLAAGCLVTVRDLSRAAREAVCEDPGGSPKA